MAIVPLDEAPRTRIQIVKTDPPAIIAWAGYGCLWATNAGHPNGTGMLILTRRSGESLYLGENIKVTVLSVQGKQIKLGLEVPKDMTVYREEVYKRVQEQNKLAIESKDDDLLAVTNLWQGKKKESSKRASEDES